MSSTSTELKVPPVIQAEIGQKIDISDSKEQKLISENIKNNNYIIYNNNGETINDINKILENNNQTNSESSFFIFSKKYEKEKILTTLEESNKKLISEYEIKLNLDQQNLPDVYTHYNLLEEKSSSLKYINSNDIKTTYEKMLEFFENYKVIFTTFKLNSHICETLKNNYKNQSLSINSLINNINKVAENCDSKKNEVISEFNKLSEIKEKNLKILNDGLENLRKQELHPILQTNDKKYLIDVYFDVKKMEIWKDDCIEQSELISKSIREKSTLYLNETNKIVSEKALSVTEIKNDWSNISLEYDNKLNGLINEPNKVYDDLLKDFLFFKQSLLIIFDYLNTLNENKEEDVEKNKNFEDACQKINELKIKYDDFSSLTELQSKLDPINELTLKMRKNLENFSLRINKIFNNFLIIQNNLNELSEKFINYKDKIIKLEESFNTLKNPAMFPTAYEAALEEIKRRMIFNYKIKKFFETVEKFVNNESKTRVQFRSIHGKYLPSDLFPFLKFTDLKIKFEINNEDELSKFPKLLNDSEIKLLSENNNNILSSIDGNPNLLLNSYAIEEKNSKDNINKNEDNDLKSQIINKEIKIQELEEELSKKKQLISNLEMQNETSSKSFDKICENFRYMLANKDKEIQRKIKESDNMISYINNKINRNIETCPLCKESAINNEHFYSINSFLTEIQKKLSNKDLLIQQIQEKYNDLVIQITQMKKVFFNYMNTKISENNFNNYKNNINGGVGNPGGELQILKSVLNEEKLKYNNVITELNLSKAKYESLLCDKKKLENKYEQQKVKINSLNEKLITALKENVNFKEEIILQENKKKIKEETIINLRNNLKQLVEEKDSLSDIKNKEIQKIKNQSITFKNIKQGDRCIFVPHSDNIYVCINLTQDLNQITNKYFRCDILLDFSSFDEIKKNLIIDNSLIVIGLIEELKECDIKEGEDNPYIINNEDHEENEIDDFSGGSTLTSIKSMLKTSKNYYMAKVTNVDYIIGFPGEELVFMNYNGCLSKKVNNK